MAARKGVMFVSADFYLPNIYREEEDSKKISSLRKDFRITLIMTIVFLNL